MADAPHTAHDPQLLHLVIGGEMRHPAEPVFRGRDNPRLPGDVPGGVWSSSDDDVTAADADDGSAPAPPAASPAPATTEE